MNQRDTQLARPAAEDSVWDRLNMEGIARRLIQTARVATAEHMMARVREAARRRDATIIQHEPLREDVA